MPLTLLITLALLILSPGSPIFFHKRIGQAGRPFDLVKFRTMRSKNQSTLNLTIAGDSRVTYIGRFLRRFKLDEIPQLLNILSGSMTFVGPRPETPEFVALYTPAQREILNYNPGLTDPASLKYRHEEKILASCQNPIDEYVKRLLPDKINISLQYQESRTTLTDIRIVFSTVASIFRRHGENS